MADTYDVYFGTPGNLVQIAIGQSDLSVVVPAVLEYNTIYNWRVDSINIVGTTTGDTWSFTALVFAPPTVSIDGSGNPTGLNNMVTLKRIVVAANNSIFYET
ncbi:hypothetical protein LCGC14_1348690 [marine sediment metagenome]|uniref:Uncharacterized protein n=1 Tax=marine sediment metagenome TaxID=412755 RepID=A0A0F9NDS9_9ZZZZ